MPDDVIYDRITDATSSANVFAVDDGYGNIHGKCSGSVNYETGKIILRGAPRNAEFVVSVSHTSVFSGKLNSDVTGRKNSIVEVLAVNPCQKADGKADVVVS